MLFHIDIKAFKEAGWSSNSQQFANMMSKWNYPKNAGRYIYMKQLDKKVSDTYLAILKEELVPATGCTEPAALAFAVAKAREVLGAFPEQCTAYLSGNIIKNVRSVVIPNTGGQVGIETALLAGLVAGHSDLKMGILSELGSEHVEQIKRLRGTGLVEVKPLISDAALHIIVRLHKGTDFVKVEIKGSHTNVVRLEKNGAILLECPDHDEERYLGSLTDRSSLNVHTIYSFADTVALSAVTELLDGQISMNLAIAEEGMKGRWGVAIGQVLAGSDSSIISKIKAYTAAASEARMSGCTLPVVTNSGSGNQGIAASVPVIMYARSKNCSSEKLYRALILSNLLTIHQKTLIGRLSAFCGVVSAACASGAAITYLEGGSFEQVAMSISNTLANTAGIICDGAKPSCGAKIASSLDSAYMGHLIAMQNRSYSAGDGILKSSIEETIAAVGRVARDGMRGTDECIMSVMLDC
jgi:L-cysteine desulfidase